MRLEGRITSMKEMDILELPKSILSGNETGVVFDVEGTLLKQIVKTRKRSNIYNVSFKAYRRARNAVDATGNRGHKIIFWSTSPVAIEKLLDYGRPFTDFTQTIAGLSYTKERDTSFKYLLAIHDKKENVAGIEDDNYMEPLNRVAIVKHPRELSQRACEAHNLIVDNVRCTECIRPNKCRYTPINKQVTTDNYSKKPASLANASQQTT